MNNTIPNPFQWSMTPKTYEKLKAFHDKTIDESSKTNDIFGAVYCNRLCIEFSHTADESAWYAYSNGYQYDPDAKTPQLSPKSTTCEALDDIIPVDNLLDTTNTFEEFKRKAEELFTEKIQSDKELLYKAMTEIPAGDKDIFFIKIDPEYEDFSKKQNTYTVEISYDAFASYDIQASSPEEAIEIAREKDQNCEKNIEICFESDPQFTVMDNCQRIIESITPTPLTFSNALHNIIQKAKEKYKNEPEKTEPYLKELGFSDDLLTYFKIH